MPLSPDLLSWTAAVNLLAQQSGVVMLVGATDVGKTTLTLQAANAAVRAGRKAAILDTDLGQSEVGPPGTIGVVRLDEPVATVIDLKPRLLAFVGDTSPFGHLLPVIQGTRRLAAHAVASGDDVVFVDTSGIIEGRIAEKLKLAKLTMLDPQLVVLVQRDHELDRLAGLLSVYTRARIVRVQSPPEAGRKSTVYRRVRRANRMRRHFENARIVDIDAASVQVLDAWLYTGERLVPRQLGWLSQILKTSIPHGEVTPDGVFLCAEGRPAREGYQYLPEEFGRRRVSVTAATAFRNLLVGLVGEGGHVVDIGLLQGVNFERALFSILTPARSTADVRLIHFGRLRLRPDGSEIARLRPSDL